MKLYVIGIGPGGQEEMTLRAVQALKSCNCVVGYRLYLDLIAPLLTGKEMIASGMMQEIERCMAAKQAVLDGKTVAVISSGDAGIYGMASLIFEVCQDNPQIEIEVIPGITAACSAAAVLGSPITNDFVVISLSDLLTPWETIEKRLQVSAQGDFCLCIYNPSSKQRKNHLQKACDILLKTYSACTPCGLVRNAGREGQTHEVTTLIQLRDTPVDMLTTVIIGNSKTKVIHGRLVTPRGYRGI